MQRTWVWEVHNRVGTIGWLAGEVVDIGRLDQLIFGSDNEIIVVCVRNIRWICDDGGVILDPGRRRKIRELITNMGNTSIAHSPTCQTRSGVQKESFFTSYSAALLHSRHIVL